MFINFTPTQISTIRNEIFPAPKASTNSSFYISQITINSLGPSYEEGTTLNCDFFVTVRDELNNPKIFREEKAKKFMKLRVFQILSKEMKEKLSTITNIFVLEKLLNDYGIKYVDMNAGVGFLGSINNPDEHYVEYTSEEDTTGIVHLVYKNKLYFNKKDFSDTDTLDNISYFGLGAVLFYDIREYIKDNEILEQFSFKETFISNIASYDLIVNGDNVEPQILRDLRIINVAFTQNNNLIRLINEQNKLGSVTKNPNDLKIQQKQSFFSSLYLSKVYGTVDNETKIYASGFFDVDFNSMIYENSPYKKYFKNLSPETLNQIKTTARIKSINIIRKRINKYKQTNSVKTINDFYDSKTIISSGDKTTHYVAKTSTKSGYIEEIQKNNGDLVNDYKYRTIHFLDKSIADQKSGIYQYGLQIEFLDSLKEFIIYNVIPALRSSLNTLNLYLNETNNIVKTNNYTRTLSSNALYNAPLKDGYYDPLTDRFTYGFTNDPNSPYNKGTAKYIIANKSAIINYIGAAKIFGLLQQGTKDYEKDVLESLSGLLDPDFANIKSINYCINIFEKLMNALQNIINLTKSNKSTIDYWFTNDYYEVDTSLYIKNGPLNKKPTRGYKFLPTLSDNKLQIDDLAALFQRNIDAYISDTEKKDYENDSDLKICLGPTSIYNKESSIHIPLDSNANIVTLQSPLFSNLEESIRKEKLFNYSTNEFYDDVGDNVEKSRQKFADFLSNFSISVSKSFYTSDEIADREKNLFFTQIKDSIQPYAINNILLKSININNKKLNLPSGEQRNCILGSSGGSIDLEFYKQNACFQINSILDNKNILLFDIKNIKDILPQFFVRDVVQNSKYNLLFATVHKIQYLEYGINGSNNINKIKEESWKDLNKSLLNDLINTDDKLPVLCRMVPTDLDGIYNDISMPIFNKHFLLVAPDSSGNVIASDVATLTVDNIEFEEQVLNINLRGSFIDEETANYIPELFTVTTESTKIKTTPPTTIPQRFDRENVLGLGNRFGIDLDIGTRFGFLDTSKIEILKTPGGSFTTPRLGIDGGIELGIPKVPNSGLGAGVESQPSSTPENPPVPSSGLERTGAGGGRVGAEIKGGAKKFGSIGSNNTPNFNPNLSGGKKGPFGGSGNGPLGGGAPPGGFGGF